MSEIGFRILFVGVGAGVPLSLRALNKPLKSKSPEEASRRMYESNVRAIDNAKKYGVAIKAGFVLGHLGMTKRLLDENLRAYRDFLSYGRDVMISADIELLSPEPGSKDYLYLTSVESASGLSESLGLKIASEIVRRGLADKYRDLNVFDREEAIGDYITAFMPELSRDDLYLGREYVRSECRGLGIVVGDDL